MSIPRRDQQLLASVRDAHRRELYATALAAPPLTPQHTPQNDLGICKLRVPPHEAPLQAHIKAAHSAAASSSAEAYEATMRSEVARRVQERPVFWSKVWPAGFALARLLREEERLCAGKAVLELGAGIGICAICAALAGASRVIATDIEPVGLMFCAESAKDNRVDGNVLQTLPFDWNEAPPAELDGRPFDVVLAGDVVYQEAHAPRLGTLLCEHLVRPHGTVIFSDSLERPHKGAFRSELCERLCRAGFVEQDVRDVVLDPQKIARLNVPGGIAGGHAVRILVYQAPPPRRA